MSLQSYLDKGLVKSKFVNLEIRKLGQTTNHEFIEWCGIIDGTPNPKLKTNTRIYMQVLYADFIEDYPDYAPRTKMSLSRTKFYRFLQAYGDFKDGIEFEKGRDSSGNWMILKEKEVEYVSEF